MLIYYVIAFLFGILIGNFTTTVYHRLPRNISILGFDENFNNPPMCSTCGARLKFYEYLPLLSWITAFGKCNYCKCKIDPVYTILEMTTGAFSIVIFHWHGFNQEYILLVMIFSLLLLQLALYVKYSKTWLSISIITIFTIILLRTIVEGTIYGWIINLVIASSVIIHLLKCRLYEYKINEVFFIMFSIGSGANLYFFLIYAIIMMVFFTGVTDKMTKIKYLYYGGVLALFIIIFFNYVMPQNFNLFNRKLPSGFVYLSDVAPDIKQDVKYATKDNFTGDIVPGYKKEAIILTEIAARKLKLTQEELKKHGFCLKVFDGYRPVAAVKAFEAWAKSPDDPVLKARFYPNIDKKELLNGYISARSSHSRGSAVDLTIIDMVSGAELDMGTIFDFLDPKSNTDSLLINDEQRQNRNILRVAMEANGFEGYNMEWWHFKLKEEPFIRYPEDHFDFEIN